MIKATVIADSKNEFGNRLTTMIVTFPRYILAEFNTHRMLSKNSASSRAIPFEKLIESVKTNPFIPMAWQKNHSGMQGTEYCTERETEVLNSAWLIGRDKAIEQVLYMANYANPTKQLINRMIEPYMYHTCIVSGTEWENFFALRCPQYDLGDGVIHRSKKDTLQYILDNKLDKFEGMFITKLDWLLSNKGMADIHMMELAECMWDAMNENTPKELKAGEWHIPFGDNIEMSILDQHDIATKFTDIKSKKDLKIRIATARCARVSYTIVGEEGKLHNYEADIKLHDRLSKSGHWSCFEHCARNDQDQNNGKWSGNFFGFTQYRKMFLNENVTK